MFIGRDLLSVGLVAAAMLFAGRGLRAPPPLGRVGPIAPCDVPVERPGRGVTCVAADEAARRGLRAGDRLAGDRLDGRRMVPERLAAWAAPVDVNAASPDELASLEGIGPKLAARIVAARPFVTVEEVANVRGVGRRRLARLRPRLFLDERPPYRVR